MIDLHTHSTVSDGTLSPSELVRFAHRCGITALSLTDHDTAAGNFEAAETARQIGMEFIPGIEISCDYRDSNIHILGYWIDPANKNLRDISSRLIEFRNARNLKIISRLHDLGIPLDYSVVEGIAGNEVVGRPHLAQALIDSGATDSIDSAFEEYLKRGAKAYIAKRRLTPPEGIELIRHAGGIPVLAHPCHYTFADTDELKPVLTELKAIGLRGIEAYYSKHTHLQTACYLKLAEEFDLAVSGGTDFHGSIKPDVKIGSGIDGNLDLDDGIVENLRRKAAEI